MAKRTAAFSNRCTADQVSAAVQAVCVVIRMPIWQLGSFQSCPSQLSGGLFAAFSDPAPDAALKTTPAWIRRIIRSLTTAARVVALGQPRCDRLCKACGHWLAIDLSHIFDLFELWQEDAKLIHLVQTYGPCNWSLIAQVGVGVSKSTADCECPACLYL